MDTETAVVEQPSAPSGIDAMMAQLDAAAASGKTVETKTPESAKPAEVKIADAAVKEVKTEAKVEPKPEAKEAAKVEAKVEPKKEDEPDWSKAPPKWYKIYEGHKQKTGETIKSLEAKIKALESKPVEHAGDAGKIEKYEKMLEELRNESGNYKKQLAQVDFTKSDEYRTHFIEPANVVYREAVAFISRLKVSEGEGHRAATQGDFDYIRSLPIDARRKAANEMFGEYAADVLDYTREIDRIKRNAEVAVQRHAETHERTALELEGITKRQQAEYEQMRKSSLEGIQSNETWGKWFKEDPSDPEASKLIKDGFDEIERVTSQLDKLPIDQQAAYGALFAARAAAMPRMMLEYNRVAAERDALREELEKIRGTDPGATGKQGEAGGVTAAKPTGIDGAVAVFDQMPR